MYVVQCKYGEIYVCIWKSYKKTSFDQTTRRRDNETRRRDETTRRDNETTRRPNRGGPKSIPYFSNFWTPFFWTFSQPVQETTRQRDNETMRRRDDETAPPEAIWSLCFFVGNHQVSLRLIVSSSRCLVVSLSRRLVVSLSRRLVVSSYLLGFLEAQLTTPNVILKAADYITAYLPIAAPIPYENPLD